MKKQYRTVYSIIVAFAIFLIWAKFSNIHLTRHGILLKGYTLQWVYGTKDRSIRYKFTYRGKKIISSSHCNDIYGYDTFLNRTFPVIYDTTFGKSEILIVPADFEDYNVPFPDSLNWVKQYVK